VIRVDSVSKYYGAHAAVRDLSFEVDAGEHVGLVGVNGAGKTTTLRMLAGLLLPSAGRVAIGDVDVAEQPRAARAKLGYLGDRPPLHDDMRVRGYLVHAARLRGLPAKRARARASAVEERCGLAEVAKAPIRTLSHGFRQRVGIAQAIVHEPELLILDEPITGLDPVQIAEMRQMIRALSQTVLLSTHHLGEIARSVDRVVVLHEGELAAEGPLETLGAEGERVVLEAEIDAEVLRAVQGVKEVHGERPRFEVLADRDVRATLARAVIEGGGELLHLTRERSDLEALLRRLQEES